MRIFRQESEGGSALICVLGTILVLSLIAGNVLFNCITRYNAASGQVRGWKESLYAAEAGGESLPRDHEAAQRRECYRHRVRQRPRARSDSAVAVSGR